MSRPVHSHSFNGVSFHVEIDDPYDGWCDNPDKKNNRSEYPAIRLPKGLPFKNEPLAKYGMVCLVHECLHAENYGTTEKVVERVAAEIVDLLWRLGYRRIKE